MGFRFHRSKKLFPGVRINFSKSGIGFSFGRRGARYSIGPNGTRTTLGIPGTGLSYISRSSSKKNGEVFPVYSSQSQSFSDMDYDLDYMTADPVFRRLGGLADRDIRSAVEIYTTVVGFLKDDSGRRMFRETGETYRPSKGQLALENKLLGMWRQHQIAEYNLHRIPPWKYLLHAVVLGGFSVHRFAVRETTEALLRLVAVLFLLFFIQNNTVRMMVYVLAWGIGMSEAVLTLLLLDTDENGLVEPICILDFLDVIGR